MRPSPDYHLVPLITADAIGRRLEGIVADIRAIMPVENLVVIALLKGSFVFLADLIRLMHLDGIAVEVEFLSLGSYGNTTQSSGKVKVKSDIDTDVRARPVLIVDDILDTGRTLAKARDLIDSRGAACVKTCVLLDKPDRRAELVKADIVGFTIPNCFVVGYGLDYARRHRELPFIARIEPEPD